MLKLSNTILFSEQETEFTPWFYKIKNVICRFRLAPIHLLLIPLFPAILIFVISCYHTFLVFTAVAFNYLILPILAAQMLICAVGTTYFSHPVHNLLSLIGVMISAVFLFLVHHQEFLAFTFLIVYVGAIAILFLFVIILLDIKRLNSGKTINFYLPFLFVFIILILFKNVLPESFDYSSEITNATSINTFIDYKQVDISYFGATLYTKYVLLFFLTTFILFTAMIGALALTMPTMQIINNNVLSGQPLFYETHFKKFIKKWTICLP